MTAITVNISTTLSTYFSEQLQSEPRMEELVDLGKLTPQEADELNEDKGQMPCQRRLGLGCLDSMPLLH